MSLVDSEQVAERFRRARELAKEQRAVAPDRGSVVKPLDGVLFNVGGGRSEFDQRVDVAIEAVRTFVIRMRDFVQAAVRPRRPL